MNKLFSNCKILKKIPDISKWNMINVKEKDDIIKECISLENPPPFLKDKNKKIY